MHFLREVLLQLILTDSISKSDYFYGSLLFILQTYFFSLLFDTVSKIFLVRMPKGTMSVIAANMV